MVGAEGVFVTGSYAYVYGGSNKGLSIIDVSTPSNPTLAGTFASTSGTYTEVFVLGGHAYLAEGGALLILDISTPSSPSQVGQLAQATGYGGIETIQVVSGSTTVYLGRSGGDVGLQVVDASTPASPAVSKTFTTQQEARNVYVSGGSLYSVDASKVWRYSLAEPANPQLVNSFTASGSNRIVVDGSYAYVADTSGDLDIFDISATTSPQQKGSYTAGAVIGRMSVKNGKAYLVPYLDPNLSTTSALEIVNVADPDNPTKLGEFALPGLGKNVFVPDSGNLVYVVYYTNSSTHGVQIVDVSNAASPSSVNTFQTSGKPISIWVDGTTAYVASWTLDEGGWFIEAYDVSNTSSPSLVGTASGTGTTIWDIKVSGDNVIATLPQGSVHVFAKAAFVGGATNIPAVGVAFAPESGEIATFVVDSNTTYAFTNGGMGFYGEGEFYGSGGKYVTRIVWTPFVEPVLAVAGSSGNQTLCPSNQYTINKNKAVIPINICADVVDDWTVSSITFKASGAGNDKDDISQVRLYLGSLDGELLDSGTYSADNGSITMSTNGKHIGAGQCLTFLLVYDFVDTMSPIAMVRDFAVDTDAGRVSAAAQNYDNFTKSPPPSQKIVSGSIYAAPALNSNTNELFAGIQSAVSDTDTVDGHTVQVCPVTLQENVNVTKELTIVSMQGRDKTTVSALSTADHVFDVTADNVTIRGFTIKGATAANGVSAPGGSTVASTTISSNIIKSNVTGVFVESATGVKVRGNQIDQNSQHGVRLKTSSSNAVGGTGSAQGNTISNNGAIGVFVELSGTGNSVLSNSIYGNGQLGIDLGVGGYTPNDVGDADGGANGLQNFPIITKVATSSSTIIDGRFEGEASKTFRLEFFASPVCDASKYGEGKTYVGSHDVTTDVNGESTFSKTFSSFTLPSGHVIAATATDPNGNTSEFSMCAPIVELIGLEVVQVIQDWNNSVRLIKDKTTFVRAHIQSKGTNPVADLTAVLRGFRGGSELAGSPLTPTNKIGKITVKPDIASRRAELEASLNFRLPSAWWSGTVELRLEAVDHAIECLESATTPSDCKVTSTFSASPVPEVMFVGIKWKTADGRYWSPSFARLANNAQKLEAIFPAKRLDWKRSEMDVGPVGGLITLQSLNGLNSMLAKRRAKDGCTAAAGCQRFYFGGIRGATFDELDKLYPEYPVGAPADAKFATEQPLGLALDVPGKAAISYLFSPDYSYIERNIPAHEIGHLLGREHAVHSSQGPGPYNYKKGWCGEMAPPGTADFPYSGTISGSTYATMGPMDQGPDNVIYGIDALTGKVADVNQNFALMSYCSILEAETWTWPSKVNYEATYQSMISTFGSGTPSIAVTAAVLGPPMDYLLVRGTVDLDGNTAAFEDLGLLTSTTVPPALPTGDYTLQFLDQADGLVSQVSFKPTEAYGFAPGVTGPIMGNFQIFVEANAAIAEVRVVYQGGTIGSVSASQNTPTVQVTFPNGGETISGASTTLTWTANDADGDPLTFDVQYSRDGGGTWTTLAVDWPATSLPIATNLLGSSSDGVLWVMVTDGFNAVQDDSDAPFTVANSRPEVAISAGLGGVFADTQLVFLDGLALDPEDGRIASTSLVWTSNRDGVLGSGEHLEVVANTLSNGDHLVTLTATDGSALTGSASEWVFINPTSDLEAALTVAKTQLATSTDLTYTLTVTNNGPNGTSRVTASSTLPSGVTFLSAVPNQGWCAELGGQVSCEFGTLLNGSSTSVTIVVDAPTPGTLTSTVVVTGDAPDSDESSNTATAQVNVAPPAVIPSASVWGLIVLTGLLAAAFLWLTRRPAAGDGV